MKTFKTTEDGSDIRGDFVRSLEKDIKMIYDKVDFNKPLDVSSVDYNHFSNAKECHICEGKFDGSDDKVRDHDHFTGKYRGAAHRSCNSLLRMPKHIPVVFHNLAGYDAHLFIKGFHVTPGKIDCIPNNEKFITFSKRITVGTYIDKNDGKEKVLNVKYVSWTPSSLCHFL